MTLQDFPAFNFPGKWRSRRGVSCRWIPQCKIWKIDLGVLHDLGGGGWMGRIHLCYSPSKKIIMGSKRLSAADDTQQNNYDGNDKQDVDKPAHRIRWNDSKQPKQNQNKGDCVEHKSLPFLSCESGSWWNRMLRTRPRSYNLLTSPECVYTTHFTHIKWKINPCAKRWGQRLLLLKRCVKRFAVPMTITDGLIMISSFLPSPLKRQLCFREGLLKTKVQEIPVWWTSH